MTDHRTLRAGKSEKLWNALTAGLRKRIDTIEVSDGPYVVRIVRGIDRYVRLTIEREAPADAPPAPTGNEELKHMRTFVADRTRMHHELEAEAQALRERVAAWVKDVRLPAGSENVTAAEASWERKLNKLAALLSPAQEAP
jgi:hypothetical protein